LKSVSVLSFFLKWVFFWEFCQRLLVCSLNIPISFHEFYSFYHWLLPTGSKRESKSLALFDVAYSFYLWDILPRVNFSCAFSLHISNLVWYSLVIPFLSQKWFAGTRRMSSLADISETADSESLYYRQRDNFCKMCTIGEVVWQSDAFVYLKHICQQSPR